MSHRESDDDYQGVVARWGNERVIVCCDQIQWIWQIHSGNRWRSRKFFRTREGILRRVKPDQVALETLKKLPDML